MIITWQGFPLKWIQGGKGIIKENISGHIHSKNSYELHYIIDGKGTLYTENHTYNLDEGIFFITGPDVYHEQQTDYSKPLTEVHCYLQVNDPKTKDILVSLFLEHTFFIKRERKYKKLFLQIAEEYEHKYIGYESVIESCLNFILTDYTRNLMDNYRSTNLVITSDMNDRRFLQIEEEFINNVDNITLSYLADKIGLCERQTQRLLLKYYGMNFKQIKNNLQSKKHQ